MRDFASCWMISKCRDCHFPNEFIFIFHFFYYRTAHKSSKKLYEQCVKLEKLWSHVFTTTVPLTQRDTWYRKLREAIDREQNQAIWVSEAKVIENSFHFLIKIQSRLVAWSLGGLFYHFDLKNIPRVDCGIQILWSRSSEQLASFPKRNNSTDSLFTYTLIWNCPHFLSKSFLRAIKRSRLIFL